MLVVALTALVAMATSLSGKALGISALIGILMPMGIAAKSALWSHGRSMA